MYIENHVAIPNESKDGQWMMSKQTEAKIRRHIRRELSSKDIMRESEVEDYRQRVLSTRYNISYDMPVKERLGKYTCLTPLLLLIIITETCIIYVNLAIWLLLPLGFCHLA